MHDFNRSAEALHVNRSGEVLPICICICIYLYPHDGIECHYRKRESASYIVREVRSVRERERERYRERERERETEVTSLLSR